LELLLGAQPMQIVFIFANNDGALETSMKQWMNCPSIPKEKEGLPP
jgi:hypothetical protein